MKRIALTLIICLLALSPALAESTSDTSASSSVWDSFLNFVGGTTEDASKWTEGSTSTSDTSVFSNAWDAFLNFVGDTTEDASKWAEESTSTSDTSASSSAWDSFLNFVGDTTADASKWTNEATDELTDWSNGSEIYKWLIGASQDFQALIDENGPAIHAWFDDNGDMIASWINENSPTLEAWLAQATQEVQQAWDTIINASEHTAEEVREAWKVIEEEFSTDTAAEQGQ